MPDEFFALIVKVQCIYYYSSPRKMWILEKSILEVLGQKYLKFAIVKWDDCLNTGILSGNYLQNL